MKNDNLKLYEIVNMRISKDLDNDLPIIEGKASCGCCYRYLNIEEAKDVIERLIEEKRCDIEYLEKQKNIISDFLNLKK